MKIDKKIEVQKVENGQVSGIISIRSTEDTVIEKLSITVVIEATGKMDAETCVINSQVIDHNVYLEMHNTLEMPFCIEFDDTKLTYHGKNATIQYGCQLEIGLDDNKLGDSFKLFFGNKNYEKVATCYFEVTEQEDCVYYVDEQVVNLTHLQSQSEDAMVKKLTFVIWILSCTIIFLLYVGALNFKEIAGFMVFSIILWFLSSVIALLIVAVLEHLGKSFKTFTLSEVMIKPEQGGFKFEFINDACAECEDLKIFYCIEEHVVDGSGSTSSHYNESFYKSQVIEATDRSQELLFSNPQQQNLQTFEFNTCVSVKWSFEISLTYQSYKELFAGDFVVNIR